MELSFTLYSRLSGQLQMIVFIVFLFTVNNCNTFMFLFIHWQLDINTVAAGGGSRLFFRAGLFVVGPESAGAHPGPVCYRKGKTLAVEII